MDMPMEISLSTKIVEGRSIRSL
jgi:hypothetical protein